jgi:hypothetical protein
MDSDLIAACFRSGGGDAGHTTVGANNTGLKSLYHDIVNEKFLYGLRGNFPIVDRDR